MNSECASPTYDVNHNETVQGFRIIRTTLLMLLMPMMVVLLLLYFSVYSGTHPHHIEMVYDNIIVVSQHGMRFVTPAPNAFL